MRARQLMCRPWRAQRTFKRFSRQSAAHVSAVNALPLGSRMRHLRPGPHGKTNEQAQSICTASGTGR